VQTTWQCVGDAVKRRLQRCYTSATWLHFL